MMVVKPAHTPGHYCYACEASGLTRSEAEGYCHDDHGCRVRRGWFCGVCGNFHTTERQTDRCCP